MPNKLLLVEDDTELANRLRESLELQNYMVEIVNSGEDAIQLLESFPFDVIILDWTLTDITGLDVCRRFRRSGGTTPILFLTGHGDIQHKEAGLDSGADDYLVKPFHERELLARLRTLLRRPPVLQSPELIINGLKLDVENRLILDGGSEVRVTPREAALLEFLMKHPNRTFSAKALLDTAWPLKSNAFEETVRTCMKTLRHKLAKIGRAEFIKTVLGSGYIIES
jgi:OmpR-family two-component system manganese-sensing response regulator